MKQIIPHTLTLCNLLAGSVAVVFATQAELTMAAAFIALGACFDFLDGFAARMLKAESPMGLQLDSLADVVTFGLVPAVILMQLIDQAGGGDWKWLGLAVVVASAYRLARFNVDDRQTEAFIGLPAPANALLIASLPCVLIFQPSETATAVISNTWALIVLTLFSCVLLNAPIRLFSLKFKTLKFKANSVRYLFLILSVALLVVYGFAAVPAVMGLYLAISAVYFSLLRKRQTN